VAEAEVAKPFYRGFLSYSTEPDYELAREVETYIESFHQRAGIRRFHLERLEICRDGSDFRLPLQRGGKPLAPGSGIRAILDGYLDQSMYLIVLCSRRTPSSPYVKYEIEHFLQNHSSDAVLSLITEGEDPSQKPDEVFPPELLAAGALERPWYDLRGHRAKRHRDWHRVRNFEEELVRLTAHLHDDSAGRIYPAWQRAEERKRKLRIASAFVSALLVTGLSAGYLWTRTDRYLMTRIAKEATALSHLNESFFAQSYPSALTCSFSSQDALKAAELTEQDRNEAIEGIAVVLAKSDRPQHALEMIKRTVSKCCTGMDLSSVQGDSIGKVAVALAGSQHPVEALAAVDQIAPLRERSYYLLQLTSLAKFGATQPRFSALIDRTLRETTQLKDHSDIYQAGFLAAAMASSGRVDEARHRAHALAQAALLPSAHRVWVRPLHQQTVGDLGVQDTDYLVSLAETMAVPELKAEVLPIVGSATQSLQRFQSADPFHKAEWQMLLRIGGVFVHLGLSDNAVGFANAVARDYETLERDDVLSGIGQTLIANREFDRALGILGLVQKGSSADALVDLAAQLATEKDPGHAINAVLKLESIRDPEAKAYDLARFAQALASAGLLPAAAQVAGADLIATRSVNRPDEKANDLAYVAAAFAEAGHTAEARTSLKEASVSIGQESGAATRSILFLRLTEALCRLHAYHEAFDMANQCWRPEDKVQAYAAILRAYAVERNAKLRAACGP
jgi:hypothetical protein